MEEPPAKISRGPYRRYVNDPNLPIPRTTRWRMQERSRTQQANSSNSRRDEDDSHDHDTTYQDISENDSDSEQDVQNSSSEDENSCEDSDDSDANTDDSDADTFNSLSTSSSDESDNDQSLETEMSEPIYPGAMVTVLAAYCAILQFKVVHRLPFTTVISLLQLLQILCPLGNRLPTTKYQLITFSRRYMSRHSRKNYCRTCMSELQGSRTCSNNDCLSEEPNCLIRISSKKSLRRIISENWDKMCSHDLTKKGIIGTIFNIDEVSPFKASRLTIWPIYLAFLNLPPAIRMLKRNIVTCAFWVGNCKPPMSAFLGHLKQTFSDIGSNGLEVITSKGIKTVILQPLFGVFDLVAKAPVMNMVQFNGINGCPSCLHPGSWVGTRVYLPGNEYPLRTKQMFKDAASEAERDGVIKDGIKGKSVLSSIVDLPLGAPIDYMHCVLEGVVKRLLEKWVASTSHGNPYYVGRNLKHIDSSLVAQCPPHDFSRAPRSIEKHRKHWKASEYRSWLLYYSLPLLLGFLPPLYLHHYALLVCALHILLQPKLTHAQVDAAEEMLKDFVILLPELYGEKECVLNSHLLLHLCQHVKLWGPLWVFSAFGFESMNGHLMGNLHATYRVADQLLFSLNLKESLNCLNKKLLQTETEKTLSFLSLNPSQPDAGQELIPGSYLVGPLYSASLSLDDRRVIKSITGEWPREISTFTRVYHQGALLHSLQYGRLGGKRDSTVCSFYSDGREQYGRISKFCLVDSQPIVLVKPYKSSGSLLQAAGVPGRRVLQSYASVDVLTTFVIRVEENELPTIAVKLDAIKTKSIYVHTSLNKFVIKLPNYFEYH